jgi:hypothetical protein
MFKYMSAEVASLFAKTLRVRFTQPSDLNDPFELRPFIDFKRTAEEMREVIDAKISDMFSDVDTILSIMERRMAVDPNFAKTVVPLTVLRKLLDADPVLSKQFIEDLRRHKTEVLDAFMKSTIWETAWEQFHHSFGESVGILSLTEDPIHTLMWSHYAEQHYGAVVEFDENHPWFNQKVSAVDELRHLVRVAYIQSPHPCTWKELNGLDVLYTKNAEWAYEREWRIIRPLSDGVEISPGKFCFDVPAESIRSIVFGYRTTPTLERRIRDLVSANSDLGHVRFRRITLLAAGKLKIVDASA